MPTVLELAGIAPDEPDLLDGRSLLPLLKGDALRTQSLYWHFPHWGWPSSAIRKGNYKLIHFYGRDSELYDLEKDLSETHNLATELPEKAEAMKKELLDWLDDNHALMPLPNPDFDPSLPTQAPRPEVTTSGELIMK